MVQSSWRRRLGADWPQEHSRGFACPWGGPGGRPFSCRGLGRAIRQRPIDAHLTLTREAPIVCSRSDARGQSMTDHPRFQLPRGPFEIAYPRIMAAALILRLAGPREDPPPRSDGDPMLALDRALLDAERARMPETSLTPVGSAGGHCRDMRHPAALGHRSRAWLMAKCRRAQSACRVQLGELTMMRESLARRARPDQFFRR